MDRISNPLPIPVGAAKEIGERYGYDQVIIIARAVTDDSKQLEGCEHLTTWGRSTTDKTIAAAAGDHIKYGVMKWEKASTTIHQDFRTDK